MTRFKVSNTEWATPDGSSIYFDISKSIGNQEFFKEVCNINSDHYCNVRLALSAAQSSINSIEHSCQSIERCASRVDPDDSDDVSNLISDVEDASREIDREATILSDYSEQVENYVESLEDYCSALESLVCDLLDDPQERIDILDRLNQHLDNKDVKDIIT